MPLYTLWNEGTPGEILAYGFHCAVGDLVVGVSALAFALVLIGNPAWPRLAYLRVGLATLIVGLTYTIWSEWYNVQIAGNWAYTDAMPQIPGSGIGLSPLAQWIVIPLAAFWWAKR